MTSFVYDAGVLVAADRNDRGAWAEHRVRLLAGFVPLVPSPVVAQVSRSPKQAQLRRFLRGCEIVSFDDAGAHRAGALLGKTKTLDIADASVVDLAIGTSSEIVTTDADDIERLVSASGKRVVVRAR